MTNTLQLLLAKDKNNPFLSVYKSSSAPDKLEVYFEMALLEKLNHGIDSYHGKHLLARLYNAGFKRKSLVETFGYPVSTLHRWGDALLTGDPDMMHQVFSGQGAVAKITPDIERFIITKFNEIYPHNSYDYSKIIRDEILIIFKKSLSSEAIRPLLNNEKNKFKSMVEAINKSQIQNLEPQTDEIISRDITQTRSILTDKIPADNAWDQDPTPDDIVVDSALNMASDIHSSINEISGNKANTCDSTAIPRSNLPNNRKLSLSKESEPELRIHHLGIILALYFINTLEFDEKIVYQWLASILAGSVNIEQTASLDFNSLEYLLDQECITSKRHQHTTLLRIANEENANKIFMQNALLLNLKNCKYFYFDPHSISYEGMLDILKGWCGSTGKICKVYYQDFFHDDSGNPVYFKIFDNYFDMRERFKDTLIDDFREIILQDKNARPTFIIDRGIYGKEKMEAIADKNIGLVTWEKGYSKDAWNSELDITEFIIQRTKNNSKKIKTWHISFIKDENWNKIEGFYRLIVRIKPPKKKGEKQQTYEVSILTNGYISDLDAVGAMLNRWVQENDFKYMIAHFGLNEITSYKYYDYSDVKRNLLEKEFREDIQKLLIEKNTYSYEYKQHGRLLTKLNTQAKTLLLKKEKSNGDKSKFKDEDEVTLQNLLVKIKQVEQAKKETSVKISKLKYLIQKDFKILDFEKKRYMDAIKIMARNIFYKLIRMFRPIYDNFREDHRLIREITQAAGIVEIKNNMLVCQIDTPRNYTKKQKNAIDIFLDNLTESLALNNITLNGKSIEIKLLQ